MQNIFSCIELIQDILPMKDSPTSTEQLGKIDRNILRILQKDGRISYTDLAREVGLSVTPCIECFAYISITTPVVPALKNHRALEIS